MPSLATILKIINSIMRAIDFMKVEKKKKDIKDEVTKRNDADTTSNLRDILQ